ncbi:protein FAR1-RELATED SEQUENCE 8-like [Arachis hypogaea]|uniref:protein FAR1-RELATED SEQUENCE 8-like n=1 Tax=Arachis hypogaea TaxID=3818 RepID=UPI000DECB3C2|nr:protein FAR1-RELATED SEQUENCE 5-like [Arachis hypogaea]
MCNKKPSVIVTDGCDSMKAAIKAVFLKATHRLCSWHMEKNVTSNVKDEGLRQLFTRWIYSNMEIEEFEAGWDVGAEEYRLHDSFWAKETYDKRRIVLKLVQNVELMVREYQNNELEAHFKFIHGNPVITTCLDILERFVATVYTQELFLDVRKEIEGIGVVNFVAKVRRSMNIVYIVEEYGIPVRQLMVLYDRVVNRLHCP